MLLCKSLNVVLSVLNLIVLSLLAPVLTLLVLPIPPVRTGVCMTRPAVEDSAVEDFLALFLSVLPTDTVDDFLVLPLMDGERVDGERVDAVVDGDRVDTVDFFASAELFETLFETLVTAVASLDFLAAEFVRTLVVVTAVVAPADSPDSFCVAGLSSSG
jgi:hypothetical protein